MHRKAAQRGPGSNQYKDKPPLPRTQQDKETLHSKSSGAATGLRNETGGLVEKLQEKHLRDSTRKTKEERKADRQLAREQKKWLRKKKRKARQLEREGRRVLRNIRRGLGKHFDMKKSDWEWAHDYVAPTHDSRIDLVSSRSESLTRESVSMILDEQRGVGEKDLAVILGANRKCLDSYSYKLLERGCSPPVRVKATGHVVSFVLDDKQVPNFPLMEILLHHKLTNRGFVLCEVRNDSEKSENVHFQGAGELAQILLSRKPYSGPPQESYWTPGGRNPFAERGTSGYLNSGHIF